MILIAYTGNHANDSLSVRLGWAIIRLMQRGEFKRVTHMECVLEGDNYTLCSVASASLRDGGVRIKPNIKLTNGNWSAYRVSGIEAVNSRAWFEQNVGQPYNTLAAMSTKIPLLRRLALSLSGYFCNWSCLESCGLLWAYKETPSQSLARLVRDHGAVDVTSIFFSE